MSKTVPQSSPIHLSPNAHTVLHQRYLARNTKGAVTESPTQLFLRVARDIARAERNYPRPTRQRHLARQFFELMTRLDFLPNSPTLMNAGRPLQQLSACFVLPVDDALASIFDAVKYQALIHQSGGGTGFSFSRLRPRADRVATTNGIASGPVSFMRVFNLSTDVIKQGGTRRGANMGILRIDHPDILEFIALKQNPSEMTNFNLSVGITDRFMRALHRQQTVPLINPRTGRTVHRMAAQAIWDQLVQAAWHSGEPGVVFLDTINRANPTPHLGEIEATNPCGEQPLLPYESCTLGSINIANFVSTHSEMTGIDYERLRRIIPTTVRFLDNVLDRSDCPLQAIEEQTACTRKIGLGIMGFADLLIHLGIPYNSDDALTIAEELMGFIQTQAHEASTELARERGVFPGYRGSRLQSQGHRWRNATVTTIAPTGTISLIADCSAGIEPLYGIHLVRTVMDGMTLSSLHPAFVRQAEAHGVALPSLQRELEQSASIQHLTKLPASLRQLFVTAHDVSPSHHVRMQAAFQRHSDSGVSKTINLPAAATTRDVADAFQLAHQLGCKGLTVFRSGSRSDQVLSCSLKRPC
jgi:ribonucleoside-diphosphate reductase alpha chain